MPEVLTHEQNVELYRRIFGASQLDAEKALSDWLAPTARFASSQVYEPPAKVMPETDSKPSINDLQTVKRRIKRNGKVKLEKRYKVPCPNCKRVRELTRGGARYAIKDGHVCRKCNRVNAQRNRQNRVV